jgi:hypothetical protein
MAKQQFLGFLRVARNLLAHQRVHADNAPVDTKPADGVINRADIWLTPKSVQDFDIGDFPELNQDQQLQLENAVREFLHVARQVPPKEPATAEQTRQATMPFKRILEILTPYLPTSQEKWQVEAALKRVEFPPWLASWDAEFASDDDGNPEVWIDIYVDERTFPRDQAGRFASRLAALIQQAL